VSKNTELLPGLASIYPRSIYIQNTEVNEIKVNANIQLVGYLQRGKKGNLIYRKTAEEFISLWSLDTAVCILVGKKVGFQACLECAEC
jgi:hypothetical protein